MRFVLACEKDLFFYVFPNQIRQNNLSDIITFALVLVVPVCRSDEKVLHLIKVTGGEITEFQDSKTDGRCQRSA